MRARFLMYAAMVLILLAVTVLVHVQLNWINRLTGLQEEHERRHLDFAAHQFASEFDDDVASIVMGSERARPENLFHFARDPKLISGIYVAHEGDLDQVSADGSHKTVPWPPALDPLHQRLQAQLRGRGVIDPSGPAIVLPLMARRMPEPLPLAPIFPSHPPLLIVLLDRAYMTHRLFPELAHRLGVDYDFAVSDGARVVYRSNAKWSGENPEATAPMLRDNGWHVSVRNHYGAVADLVAHVRRRNILSLGHVMVILVLSLLLIAIIARRAERLREQQLEFVAGMTHELNTPLAALQAAGQNLADGVVHDEAQVARYGAVVAKEARRLGDLVAQVLDYSGLQSRKQFARTPVDVAAVVANAVDATRWLAEEKQVEVQTTIEPALPAVNGNAEALTRAVQNLIANAIRHGSVDVGRASARPGRAEARPTSAGVSIIASRTGEKIAITVEDHGPGIAPDDARHLFEPFYRGRNATARGTGLGLTIVAQVAKAHGGSITFDRHRPSGAAFTLTLPVAHG
jgi:signal transduction histidine kinase